MCVCVLADIKGEIDSNTIIALDSNIPLIPVDVSSRQIMKKETLALKDTLYLINLIDICIYNIPLKSIRIHIRFRLTGNILQDSLSAQPQNKSQLT